MQISKTSRDNIRNAFGEKSATEFMSYYSDTAMLFDCFDEPVMQNANPNLPAMMLAVMKLPSVIGKMRPVSTLEHGLAKQFSDPDCNNCLEDTRHMSGACLKPHPRSSLLFGKPRQKASGRSMAECTNWHASSKRSAPNAGLNLPTTAALNRSKNRRKQQHR